MPHQPQPDFYRQREQRFRAAAATERARYEKFTWIRLIAFVFGMAVAILCASASWAYATAFAFVFLLGFYRFVQWHQRIDRQARRLEALAKVNDREARALDGDYADYPDGAEFIDHQHPYSFDLDLFGAYSLFQFLNRTATEGGRQQLANWLSGPAETEEIISRQSAVRDMAQQLDWRQQLQALGETLHEPPGRIAELKAWLADAPVAAHSPGLRAALWMAPLWFALVVWLWLVWLPWGVALLLMAPPAWLLARKREEVDRLHLRTGRVASLLRVYADLISQAEAGAFRDARLVGLSAVLAPTDALKASAALRQLAYYLGQLDVRYNVFSILLQFGGLWDLQWAYRIDRWKEAYGGRLFAWFEALAELETLASFGNLHYNYPGWAFAVITDQPRLEGQALGHPLIHERKRVANQISIGQPACLHLITGSNMAGKSTWLRTVGLNIVLGLSGAPACALALRLPQWQVYTSMRTQDALHESTSSFYAELKRLRFILEAAENPEKTGGRPVFFILDEILKGTNSRDRHTGARALIRQLIQGQGAGLVATHDLELGALEAQAGGRIENWAMEVAIEGAELRFDYQLRQGVSQSFNATLLMQRMGIKVELGA